MAPMRDNTLKSNLVSFTGSSVEKLDILLPLIFHPSFGLSVVLGTRRKAGGWGWSGVRETVKRLLNYSLLSVNSTEWENCPKEKKREAREATDSWLGWFVLLVYTARSHKPPLSMKCTWTKPIIAPCHAQSHEIGVLKLLYAAFMLSVFCALFLSCLFLFFLIRNFTMFSLVGKKKLYRETTKQPLSCDVFLPHSVWSFTNWHTVLPFFHVALAFKLQWKHTLKSVA